MSIITSDQITDQPTIGTKVQFPAIEQNDYLCDITRGKVYEIVGYNHNGNAYFIDDAEDKDCAAAYGSDAFFIVVP
jgi:cytochrome b involved in lipid metabolism